MSLRDDLLECIAIRDRLERQVSIAGIITEALKPLGIIPIVVGGTTRIMTRVSAILTIRVKPFFCCVFMK